MSIPPSAPIVGALLLAVLGGAPLTLDAAEAQPDDQAPPVAAASAADNGAWDPASRAVLRWLDPQAPLQVALDLAAWRRRAATLKPLSLFTDPEAAPALDRLRAALLVHDPDGGCQAFHAVLFNALAQGDAAVFSLTSSKTWIHALAEPQAGADQLAARLVEVNPGGQAGGAAPPGSGTPGWDLAGAPWRPRLWAGMHGRTFAIGTPDQVVARSRAAEPVPPPAPPAGFWLRGDLGPLIAGCAALAAAAADDGRHSDLDELTGLFGAQWRSTRPQVAITLAEQAGELHGELRLSKAAPFSPYGIGRLLAKALGGRSPLPPLPPDCLRPADPACLIAPRRAALAWLALGFTPQASADLGAAVQQAYPDQAGLPALCQAFSGDVSVLLEPGAPLPVCTLALGLRAQPDAAALGTVAAGLGLGPDAVPPELRAAGITARWSGPAPWGRTQLLLAARRAVLSTASDVAPLLTGVAAQPEAAAVLDADLPQLATLYGQGLLARLPPAPGPNGLFTADCIPPTAVLARHLAPWHVAWTPTADGCIIHERGLPGVSAALALSIIGLCLAVDSADMVQAQRIQRSQTVWNREWAAQAPRLAALASCARSIAAGGPFTAEQRTVMRPWFAGRTPGEAELAALGTRYVQPGPGGMYNLVLAPETWTTSDGRIGATLLMRSDSTGQQFTGGVLIWAAPLGDGWSIAMVDSFQVGLLKGAPPALAVPKSAF